MNVNFETLSREECQLLDYITQEDRLPYCPEPEASALFACLKDMLSGKPEDEVVDGFLMQNLTAVAKAALMRDREERVPGEKGNYDHIVIRTTKAMVAALDLAIKEERTQKRCGKNFCNNYCIPNWYFNWKTVGRQ